MKYADKPYVLGLNRVKRFYKGGSNLDRWQQIEVGNEEDNSEEFIVSTIPYLGYGQPKNNGISMAIVEGKEISLTEMINDEEEEFLGSRYLGKTEGNLGVLARVGDCVERLIIQCHPSGEFAKENFHALFGKTEAWYILNTRKKSGYCYAGLKEGVTKQEFAKAFYADNSKQMLDMLHKIYFEKGDMIFIPSGMLHAMGPDTTFLEFHEPCDYTMRFETKYSGKSISLDALHYGLGTEKLLECADYTCYSEKEIIKLVKKAPEKIEIKPGCIIEELLAYEDNPYFKVDKITVNSSVRFEPPSDTHCIMIVARGEITLNYKKGSQKASQGRGIAIPARVGSLVLKGECAELLIAYPFQVGEEIRHGLFI